MTPLEIFRALVRGGCQIAILAFLLYYVLKFLRRTRAYRILAGIVAVLLALYGGAILFGFDELGWLFEQIAPAIPIVFIVLFQPELRRIFAELGTGRSSRRDARADASGVVSALVEAVGSLSRKRIGAIVAVEREESLEPYSTGGRRLDAPVNAELLLTIFYPGTSLHDGGVIVRGGTIAWAGCVFPLGAIDEDRRAYGTRHRAAIGLSERTDALVVVVSEESGTVSLAYHGELVRGVNMVSLADALRAGNYPLRPFVTFRLPGLAMVQAHLPRLATMGLLY
ncbi:MAG: diadenylate cyclase CdaA, partial [Kiritimatiellae bacterium]|nr:diadenylate cyclase CdaA [Kiritimatiellia bacterium]